MCGCARCKPLAPLSRQACGCMSETLARICSPSAEACHVTQTHFLVRAGKSRRVQESEEEITYSLDRARSWPSQGSRVLELPARHGHPGRSAQLQLSFGQLTLLPPRARATRKQGAIDRVGHSRLGRAGSPRGEEPLEWLRLPSVPTTTLEQAWERVDWYQYRWLVEEGYEQAKGQVDLDQYEVRAWRAWYRYMTLALVAYAALVVMQGQARAQKKKAEERAECAGGASLIPSAERVGGAAGQTTALVALSTPAPSASAPLPCSAPRTAGPCGVTRPIGSPALAGVPALTDEHWEQLKPLLPPQKPQTGRPAVDHRLIVEGMLWVVRTGSSWRELPERFGPWSTVSSRYQRWCKEGLWDRILHVLLPAEASFSSSA